MYVVGINGRDPNASKSRLSKSEGNYALICTYSRGSLGSIDDVVFNGSKRLFAGEDANYIMGVSGPIDIANYFANAKGDSKFHKFINNPKEADVQYVGEMLGYINSTLMENEFQKDEFLFAFESSAPKLLTLGKKGIVSAGVSRCMGEGMDSSFLWFMDEYFVNGRFELPPEKARELVLKAIRNAAYVNKTLGGYVCAAAISSAGTSLFKHVKITDV